MRERLHDPRKIRRKRYEAGLNLPELAAKAGISKAALYTAEKNDSAVGTNAGTLAKIAAALDCEVIDLLLDEGEPTDDAEDEPAQAVA